MNALPWPEGLPWRESVLETTRSAPKLFSSANVEEGAARRRRLRRAAPSIVRLSLQFEGEAELDEFEQFVSSLNGGAASFIAPVSCASPLVRGKKCALRGSDDQLYQIKTIAAAAWHVALELEVL